MAFTVTPGEPGRHRLCARWRARHAACRASRNSARLREARCRSRRRLRNSCARVRANPKAFYSVWGGANDIFYQLGLARRGLATPAQVHGRRASLRCQLGARGSARCTPAARGTSRSSTCPTSAGRLSACGLRAKARVDQRALVALQHDAVSARSMPRGIQTMRVNAFALLQRSAARTRPLTDFANATTPRVRPSRRRSSARPANFVTPERGADVPLRRTACIRRPPAHAVDRAGRAIDDHRPAADGALAEAPLAVEQANFRALDNRMWSSLNAPRATGKFQAGLRTTTAAADLQAGPHERQRDT